ncbi:hypothetical protein B0T09DRAFT_392187 [Sordaria sp. MPI-SDFR-AT-0083]|nr:hypothetical protein B0T09DRAFT_392187 [Sordaria sp. MPI-SDFR-AT-0083]
MDRAMSMCIDEFLERITCKMGNMVDILLGEQVLSALLCYTIGVEKDDVVHHFHEFHTTLPDKLSLARKAHLERATTSYIPRYTPVLVTVRHKLLDEIEKTLGQNLVRVVDHLSRETIEVDLMQVMDCMDRLYELGLP